MKPIKCKLCPFTRSQPITVRDVVITPVEQVMAHIRLKHGREHLRLLGYLKRIAPTPRFIEQEETDETT